VVAVVIESIFQLEMHQDDLKKKLFLILAYLKDKKN
jgi:hypothetical protein